MRAPGEAAPLTTLHPQGHTSLTPEGAVDSEVLMGPQRPGLSHLSAFPSVYIPKLMSIESVMPSNHLILYCPLLLLPSIFPSIRACGRPGFNPWVGKIPWRRAWHPTPVFLPGEFQGERSLECYIPWGHKQSDTTAQPQRQAGAERGRDREGLRGGNG